MQTEIMDRLFLELSQVTQATTAKELSLQREIDILKKELRDINKALDDPRVDVTITMVDKIKELQELECDDNPVAWLHAIRSDSDVITDAVKHLWGQVRQAVGKESQYTIPLYRRKERKKHD